jgi:hypothetical protein
MGLLLLDAARTAANAPVEAHAALGRGRSYGIPSRMLGRGIGGIDDSALWHTLERMPAGAGTALVMDVGNDLLYGVEPPRILAWVDAALHRLASRSARRIVVGLPMPALRRLRPWQFRLVRTLLVPGCRLAFADALAAAERLHAGLEALAAAHGATFHAPPGDWYGFDPVHVRRACWREAAQTWLGTDAAGPLPPRLDTPLARLQFRFAVPAERTLLGRRQGRAQPWRRFADGSTLSLW